MSVFLRSLSGSAALAVCATALSLSAMSCGADGASSDVSGKGGDSTSSDEGDDTETTPVVKHDAGKTTTVKHDAGTTSVKDPSSGSTGSTASTADAGSTGGGNKSPTTASGSLFCAAQAVLQDKCNACHGATPAAGAPMSLVTYDDLTAAAPVTKGKKVYEVVSTRTHATSKPMPPTGALATADLAPLDAWIAAGAPDTDAPCGDSSAAVPAASDQDWPPAGCDKSYKVLAGNGSPVMVPPGQEIHPQFTLDAPWGDDKVQAIMFRPISDNLKVLHHWILNSQGTVSTFVSGWAPGQDNTLRKPLPDGVGVYLPSGKQVLRMDMHYNNLQGTKTEADNSGVEICVTHTLRKNAATTFMNFMGLPFIAPGQETDIVGTCNVQVTEPVFLMSESPHAHKLATHMKLEHIRAGKSTILHDAPFAFDAQVSNALPAPFELKTGDQVITTCHYKNDTNNLVTFGEDTGNEMCFNFATYYPMGALSCNGQAPVDAGKAFGGS